MSTQDQAPVLGDWVCHIKGCTWTRSIDDPEGLQASRDHELEHARDQT